MRYILFYQKSEKTIATKIIGDLETLDQMKKDGFEHDIVAVMPESVYNHKFKKGR